MKKTLTGHSMAWNMEKNTVSHYSTHVNDCAYTAGYNLNVSESYPSQKLED